MESATNWIKQSYTLYSHEDSIRNERFVDECLKTIQNTRDPSKSIQSLLAFLGELLECDRVCVFEGINHSMIQNTYEWHKDGISSDIKRFIPIHDLSPWYAELMNGKTIIEPNIDALQQENQMIYQFYDPQNIHSIILSPLLSQGIMRGLLSADNPSPAKLQHISVVLNVLAYFIHTLLNQRDLQKRSQSDQLPIESKQKLPHAGNTILLIDDNLELLKCNKKVLRSCGYHIQTAETLQQARIQLSESRPDALVLDIDLPDGNGIDFFQELQDDIPVIFLSAWSKEHALQNGLKQGYAAFLTKPYQLEELRSAVAKALKQTHIQNTKKT